MEGLIDPWKGWVNHFSNALDTLTAFSIKKLNNNLDLHIFPHNNVELKISLEVKFALYIAFK